MQNKDMLVVLNKPFGVVGIFLIIAGVYGFAKYGIQPANHYNSSVGHITDLLLGTLLVITSGKNAMSRYEKIRKHWAVSLVLSSYFFYYTILAALWAIDSGSLWAYALTAALGIFGINTLADGAKKIFKK